MVVDTAAVVATVVVEDISVAEDMEATMVGMAVTAVAATAVMDAASMVGMAAGDGATPFMDMV
jgi:hypothetical protein